MKPRPRKSDRWRRTAMTVHLELAVIMLAGLVVLVLAQRVLRRLGPMSYLITYEPLLPTGDVKPRTVELIGAVTLSDLIDPTLTFGWSRYQHRSHSAVLDSENEW